MDGTTKDWGAPRYGRAWGDPSDPHQPIQTAGNLPGYNKVRVVDDPGTPTGSAVEFVFARGQKQGFAGAAFFPEWETGETYRDLYVRLLYKMDPAWTHHASGTTKIMFLGYGGGLPVQPTQFVLSNRNGWIELVDQSGDGSEPIHRALDVQMEKGRWYDIEMLIHGQSSLHAADGGMEMWINGRRVERWIQRSGGEEQRDPTPPTWRYVDGERRAVHTRFTGAQLGGWYGGSTKDEPGKPKDEWLRWGGLYISGLP
jgi:hypothetical protein